MIDFGLKGKVVVTCKDRFSSYLEKELMDLGFKPIKTERTAIELEASLSDCIFLNLHLRTASHVLYEIRSFYLHDADDIYRRIKALPWEDYISESSYFSVISHVDNGSVDNPLFVNVRIKDAIVDRFREKTGIRPDSGSALEGAVFQLFWKETQANLYINTSGETLAKHGYRKIPGKAPMLEALASATILATDWDKNSPFVNPMCGSGTLAIEAAMMATNRFPGLLRDHYAFMHIKGYDEDFYQSEKEKLKAEIIEVPGLKIIASDISEQAILFSRENASTAGVEDLIEFEVGDFEETTVPESDSGVVFFNPEYGERLGEEEDLGLTYKRMGDFMKQRCPGYTGFIFTGNVALGKKVGLRAARRIEFYNGTIDCRLLKFELYRGTREKVD
ncbi:THUMP domain-containing class I SAM-dependent RNA methyltransferase [Aquiflexum gelatinilyticum]|uniref:THUMP domain-containing class I SAM-dependent RNA methyltransferase n=1 Tax=Aquiflexum gelatinilyticum TaxID=2961943 RepID=UPI002168F6F6|nr:class I SAM-dependent RNA methyltransferase [Aquiflexum gelatinilyticum]MCS4434638.1 class I SAM-dependent RNA methyltransferase [Aquiflexum gelatinilyticum]